LEDIKSRLQQDTYQRLGRKFKMKKPLRKGSEYQSVLFFSADGSDGCKKVAQHIKCVPIIDKSLCTWYAHPEGLLITVFPPFLAFHLTHIIPF
jgi:hypothetical protein